MVRGSRVLAGEESQADEDEMRVSQYVLAGRREEGSGWGAHLYL